MYARMFLPLSKTTPTNTTKVNHINNALKRNNTLTGKHIKMIAVKSQIYFSK